MIEKVDVPVVPTHNRYSEVNKSFDSFLTQKKAQESATPMAGRAQFFQNRIEEKATGKSAEYYHQMEHAMNEHKVYELSKVHSLKFFKLHTLPRYARQFSASACRVVATLRRKMNI